MTNFKLYETQAINHTTGEIFQYNLKGRNPQEAINKIVKKLNKFYDFDENDIFEFTVVREIPSQLSRDKMLSIMINIYGFENPIVIQFAEMCGKLDDTEANYIMLKTLVDAHQEYPQI